MSFFKKLFGGGDNNERERPDTWPVTGEPSRDHFIKSRQFFDDQARTKEAELETTEAQLAAFVEEQGPQGDTSMFYFGYNSEYRALIEARYSRGDAPKTLVPLCEALLHSAELFWEPEVDHTLGGTLDLMKLGDSIALAILANLSTDKLRPLSNVMQEQQFSDILIDSLMQSQVPDHPVGTELLVNGSKSWRLLAKMVRSEDEEEILEDARTYLSKLFNTRENLEERFNRHKLADAMYYYGYWAWQLGAILKYKNVDCSTLTGLPFFPYDFVTYRP